MNFYVIDRRTGKEPIFDHNHIFKEKWFKESGLIYCDIDGWYISEDGQLALIDDCGKCVWVDPERFEVVYDIEEYAKEHNLFICTTNVLEQMRAEIEDEFEVYSPISERHKIISKVLRVIDKYIEVK